MDLPTMYLGGDVAELREFVVSVKNRRQSCSSKEDRQPVFKEILWKLKADGDRQKESDWYEREMWISKQGSLVYKSKKENKDLVYYTSEDLAKASYDIVPAVDSCKPYTFRVILPEV